MDSKVFVTGMGVVNCWGKGVDTLWSGLKRAENGSKVITRYSTESFKCKKGCYVPEDIYAGGQNQDRAKHLLLTASEEALKMSKLDPDSDFIDSQILVGTIYGGMESWEQTFKDLKNVPTSGNGEARKNFPLWKLAEDMAKLLKTQKGSSVVTTACSSSDFALGMAMHAIRKGELSRAVVGGVELLSQFIVSGFDALGSLSLTECKPFDKNRDGLVLGEGAGVLILESEELVRKRKADTFAEIIGFGSCYEAYDLSAPEPTGKRRASAISRALDDAKLNADKIGFVKAHGTGTPLNDKVEVLALKRALGDALPGIPVTSFKSMYGHTCGACGAIEAISTILALQNELIPPVAHLNVPEEQNYVDFVIQDCRPTNSDIAVQMAAGFGGSNTCVLLRKSYAN